MLVWMTAADPERTRGNGGFGERSSIDPRIDQPRLNLKSIGPRLQSASREISMSRARQCSSHVDRAMTWAMFSGRCRLLPSFQRSAPKAVVFDGRLEDHGQGRELVLEMILGRRAIGSD
jgi:hypothetical protein